LDKNACQAGGLNLPNPDEYEDDDMEGIVKERVLSVYYWRLMAVYIRQTLDYTDEELRILPYTPPERETLSEITFGKNDGIYTTGNEFEEQCKYFTEPIKVSGSPTSKIGKGGLTFADQMRNWQFVIVNKK
jgi:hypothetical protein